MAKGGNSVTLFLSLCCLSSVVAFSKDVEGVRQNFDERSNSELNQQMLAYQRASLVYMAYASYFDRSNVNLPGFRKFFLTSSEAAQQDAIKLVDYINQRGGSPQFGLVDIKNACDMMKVPFELSKNFKEDSPKICESILKKDPLKKKSKKSFWMKSQPEPQSDSEDWQHGLLGLGDALLMERTLNAQLMSVISGASYRENFHLSHVIEDSFLTKQTQRIKKLADVINRLRQYPEQDYPLGEYVIDLEMSI